MDIRLLSVSVPQAAPLQTGMRCGMKTVMFILPSLECMDPFLHFLLRLNGMMHKDSHTVSSFVCMTSVYNIVSNMCLKKCIHGCNMCDLHLINFSVCSLLSPEAKFLLFKFVSDFRLSVQFILGKSYKSVYILLYIH
jgi:hypothetical protein